MKSDPSRHFLRFSEKIFWRFRPQSHTATTATTKKTKSKWQSVERWNLLPVWFPFLLSEHSRTHWEDNLGVVAILLLLLLHLCLLTSPRPSKHIYIWFLFFSTTWFFFWFLYFVVWVKWSFYIAAVSLWMPLLHIRPTGPGRRGAELRAALWTSSAFQRRRDL